MRKQYDFSAGKKGAVTVSTQMAGRGTDIRLGGKDGEGRDIDFRNTVIIMTSNAGTDTIDKLCADPEMAPEPEALRDALMPAFERTADWMRNREG